MRHPCGGIVAFIVHSFHQRRLGEVRFAEAEHAVGRLVQRDLRSGDLMKRLGEVRPRLGGSVGPVGARRPAVAFTFAPKLR
jgi:hypothetical protein